MKSRIKADSNFTMTDKLQGRIEIINYMADKEYFKHNEEYIKAFNFVVRNLIPDWLIADMKIYYQEMKG